MSIEAKKRRVDLWRKLRRLGALSATTFPVTSSFIFTLADVKTLYSSFAYGGKDRMHDDLVKLVKEGYVLRSRGQPAKWTALAGTDPEPERIEHGF